MSEQWGDINSWSGWVTATGSLTTSPDQYTTVMYWSRIDTRLLLYKDPSGGPYNWFGTQTSTAQYAGKTLWNDPPIAGLGVGAETTSGTSKEEPCSLWFNVEDKFQPVGYNLDGASVNTTGAQIDVYQQAEPPPMQRIVTSGPYSMVINRESIFANLPAKPGALKGSKISPFGGGSDGMLDWALYPTIECIPQRCRIWINAFIPQIIPDNPDLTPFRPGAAKVETMTPVPPSFGASISNYVLTDQRGFSAYSYDPGCMQSLIEIDMRNGQIKDAQHVAYGGMLVDKLGKAVCVPGSTDTANMRFGQLQASGPPGQETFTVTVTASSHNDCWHNVGKLCYNGTISIDRHSVERYVDVRADMMVLPFPAFEMYATLNDGPPMTLFKRLPDTGSSLRDVGEPPVTLVSGSVYIPCVSP